MGCISGTALTEPKNAQGLQHSNAIMINVNKTQQGVHQLRENYDLGD